MSEENRTRLPRKTEVTQTVGIRSEHHTKLLQAIQWWAINWIVCSSGSLNVFYHFSICWSTIIFSALCRTEFYISFFAFVLFHIYYLQRKSLKHHKLCIRLWKFQQTNISILFGRQMEIHFWEFCFLPHVRHAMQSWKRISQAAHKPLLLHTERYW